MGILDRYSEKKIARLEKKVAKAAKRSRVEALQNELLGYEQVHDNYVRDLGVLREGKKIRMIERSGHRYDIKAKREEARGRMKKARMDIVENRAKSKRAKLENQRYRRETKKMREVRKDRPDPTPIYYRSGGYYKSRNSGSSASYKR